MASNKLARWLRHSIKTPQSVNRAFPPAVLRRIQDEIAEGERVHSGEIRFAVEAALPWSYLRRNAPARERAEMVFAKLRVWDTEENNGVLIYIELADHRIEIVADRGIARHVPNARWEEIVADDARAISRPRVRGWQHCGGARCQRATCRALSTRRWCT